jgi:hypothetical protein
MRIQFIADKVKIAGPKIDGSYTISFEVGEYAYDQIMHLPKFNGEAMYVEVKDDSIKSNDETSK